MLKAVTFTAASGRRVVVVVDEPTFWEEVTDAAIEKAVRAVYGEKVRINRVLDSIYDGVRPYDAERYEPGDWLGTVSVKDYELGDLIG